VVIKVSGRSPRDFLAVGDLDRFQYLLLMGACLLVTLPLELVIGARVWRQPRRLLAALAVPAVIFLIWDVWAIARGHWTFSERFTTGWDLGPLPVEEISFFVVIPVCGLLTFEAVQRLTGNRQKGRR
jgi:lycopene beta-cyclase